MIRNPKAILALLTGLNLLNYLDRYVLSAVLQPLQADLQLSDFVGGSLAMAFLLGFFVTSPVFGYWADRSEGSGRKLPIVLGVAIWSLATIASGLAQGPGSLLAARVVVGIGEASFVTIAPTIIDEIAPPGRKGSWLSIFYTAIPVGSAFGYLAGGAIFHATQSWRQAFFLAGAPGLALGVLCMLVREPDRQLRPERPPLFRLAGTLLRIPLYRDVVLGQCAYTFAIGGFAYWAPKYIAARYLMESGRASFVFGLVTVAGGAIGTLVGGRLGDLATRKGSRGDEPLARGNLAVCVIATGIAAPLAAAAIAAGTSSSFFALTLPCEIALFVPGGPFNVAVLRSVPSELRASAMAWSIFASHLFGDLWSPPLIGLVTDVAHAAAAMPRERAMAWAMLICPVGFAAAAVAWGRGWRGSS